jgi:hypothetical protein
MDLIILFVETISVSTIDTIFESAIRHNAAIMVKNWLKDKSRIEQRNKLSQTGKQ